MHAPPAGARSREPDTCILLVGHGSRDASVNAEFEALVATYRARHPELRVMVGYIELARPLLVDALDEAARSARRVVLVPLFLFAAGHVKNDLPLAVEDARARFPGTAFSIAPCLGVHPALAEVAYDRAAAALGESGGRNDEALLLVVGRGASDPDANGDFYKMARLIAERREFVHVEVAHLGITQPSVDRSLEWVARLRPRRLVVLPYLLFAGRLIEKLAASVEAFARVHPWIRTSMARHLGADERLAQIIDERARGALAGSATLACDACQYRVALPGLADQVGGLRALLYSVRHTMTHSQAAMPLHAHRPLKKHVFVCGNADCVDRGSIGVLERLRGELKCAGRSRTIRVTRTSCMGRCGEGPTVAVYPDGVWYRGVQEADAKDIVHEHLLGDRLVDRLVGDILN